MKEIIKYCILNDGRRIGIVNDEMFRNIYNRDYIVLEILYEFSLEKEYTLVDKEEIEGSYKLYKAILYDDSGVYSYYNNEYRYKLNEYAFAENLEMIFGGIYASHMYYIENSCYFSKENACIVEVKYDLDDLLGIDAEGNVRFKKLFIKDIVKKKK